MNYDNMTETELWKYLEENDPNIDDFRPAIPDDCWWMTAEGFAYVWATSDDAEGDEGGSRAIDFEGDTPTVAWLHKHRPEQGHDGTEMSLEDLREYAQKRGNWE